MEASRPITYINMGGGGGRSTMVFYCQEVSFLKSTFKKSIFKKKYL